MITETRKIAITLLAALLLTSCDKTVTTIFIEAESFSQTVM